MYGLEIQVRSSARLTFEIVQPCLLKVQIAKRKSNFCEPSPTHCPSECPSVKRQCPMKQRDCGSEPNNFTQQPSDTCLWKNNRCKNERGARLRDFCSLAILPSCYQSGPLWVLPSHPTAASSLLHWPKPRAATSVATRMGQRPLRNSAHMKKQSIINILWEHIFADYLSEHGLAPVEICHHELQLQATCKQKRLMSQQHTTQKSIRDITWKIGQTSRFMKLFNKWF